MTLNDKLGLDDRKWRAGAAEVNGLRKQKKSSESTTTEPLSDCCHAEVIVAGDGTTHYYVCVKCGMACDAVQEEEK